MTGRPIRLLIMATVAATAMLMAGCGSGDGRDVTPTTPTRSGEGLGSTVAVDGLSDPLLVAARPGDGALYVVEQGGRIRSFRDGREGEPLLDVGDLTDAGGEQGLLGLAFHPDHEANGLLYVNYTDRGGATNVVEYRAPAGGPAIPESARVVLEVGQPYSNHNGGNLAFGPDGMLYIGLGDGGSGGDPENRAQDLESLLGKMLRIDVDGRDPGREYRIPADNPFVDRPDARPEIWALGLRNPWRYSFDPVGGTLWIGDVGQGDIEEVDRVTPDEGSGANFGWSRFEGSAEYDGSRRLSITPAVAPVAEYRHDVGCSVTGGVVVRSGPASLEGRYLYGDYCSGRVWSLDADDPAPGPEEFTSAAGGPFEQLRSFGVDGEGTVYLVAGGRVLRLTSG
ncbi:MAG: PQQ-dependent sugar dehydrogenase [Thermoleophilia bacterium]